MYKIFNIVMFSLIIIFIFATLDYYLSNKNINETNYKRSNIDQILKEKITNLPVLPDDTSDVIEFNNSIDSDINNEKKRSFWDLITNK